MAGMRSLPVLAGLVLVLVSPSSAASVASEPAGGPSAVGGPIAVSGPSVTGGVSPAAICGRPAAISHRGIGVGAPESTLRGFRGVARVGVNILESDIQFTRDQVPIIMHDATVNRTTDGQGRVSSLTIRQIRRLNAGEGTRVPRLRGLVALAARRNVNLLAELKAQGATRPQVRKVLRIVRSRGMGSHTTIHSRHRANLRKVNRIAPRVKTMWVLDRRDGFRVPPRFVDTVGVNNRLVTQSRVRRWHRNGVRVFAFTVNRRSGWRRLNADGVNGIVTDRPGAYLRWARRGCR
jgi:glycerophosphoryl diester phosphodiesterase